MSVYGRHKSIPAKLLTPQTSRWTLSNIRQISLLFIFTSINIHHIQERLNAEQQKNTNTWFIVNSNLATDA